MSTKDIFIEKEIKMKERKVQHLNVCGVSVVVVVVVVVVVKIHNSVPFSFFLLKTFKRTLIYD
jgi:hypothetical protein